MKKMQVFQESHDAMDYTIKSRKLKWYGHVKSGDLPVRITVEGHIESKHHRGKPRQRWRDYIIV